MSRYCSGFNDLAGEKVDGLSPAGRRTVEQVRVTSPVRPFYLADRGETVPADPRQVVDLAVQRAAPGVAAMAGAVLHSAASLHASLGLECERPAPLRAGRALSCIPGGRSGQRPGHCGTGPRRNRKRGPQRLGGYGRTPKSAPHSWVSMTPVGFRNDPVLNPVRLFTSSCGLGTSVGNPLCG